MFAGGLKFKIIPKKEGINDPATNSGVSLEECGSKA
jgi:hypothetical protein